MDWERLNKLEIDWEVYVFNGSSISAVIEGGKLKTIRSSREREFAIRVIKNGKLGFASGNRGLEGILDAAIKIARVSEDEMKSFPTSGRVKRVKGIYDEKVEEMIENPENVEGEVERIDPAKGKVALSSLTYSCGKVSIANSNGIELEEEFTSSSFMVEIVYNSGSGYEGDESRSWKLEIERAVSRAEELAIMSSKAGKIESGYYDVVLEPIAVHQLFSNTLYPSLSAENVFKGRSLVKIGDVYGKITVVDDPLLEGGLMSSSFDDEGVASRKTALIVDGEVKNYYTDWKYAERMGIEPTSNGYRPSPSSPPSPSPSNLLLEGKEVGEDEGKVLSVHSLIGAHTSNPVSGDFSVECMNAVLLRNGDAMPIKGAMLYGNIFELLKNFLGVSGERRQIGNTVAKSMAFEKVRVV